MKKGLSADEKFCLAAYTVNKDADTAYRLSRKGESAASGENLHRMALRWIRSEDAQAYIKSVEASTFQKTKDSEGENRSKSDIVRELDILASQTHEPKLRSELLMRIVDAMKMQEKEKEAVQTKHFYLPVRYPTSCKDCLLNPALKKPTGEQNG